jgi:DNA-binding ferritin-like protein
MKELASILLHSQTQGHIFHWRVKGKGSYAAHKALQKYYESIDGLVDGLVEAYQGKNGLVFFDSVEEIDNNATIENVIKYFDKLIAIVDKLRKGKDLEDSFFQNEIDNIVVLLYATKYKLENLE